MTEEEDELKTEVRGGVGCILLNRHSDQILPSMQPFSFSLPGILIIFRHKCNLSNFHCQAKEAELPESGNDPKDDKNY